MTSLLRNGSFNIIANLLSVLANFAWLSYFNYRLELDLVGFFLSVLALSAPLIVYSNLDLRKVISADVNKKWGNSSYFYLRVFSNFVAVTISCILFSVVLGDQYFFLGVFILLAKYFESVSELIYGYFTRSDKQINIFISRSVKFLSTIICVCFLVVFEKELTVELVFLLYFLTFSLPFFLFDLCRFDSLDFKAVKLKEVKELFEFSNPVAFEALFVSLFSSLPILFVATFSNASDAAVFGSVSYISAAIQIAFSSVLYSQLTVLKKSYENSRKQFMQLLNKLICLIFLLVVMSAPTLLLGADLLLSFFFNWQQNQIASLVFVLRVQTVLLLVTSTLISTFIFMSENTRLQRNIRLFKLLALLCLLNVTFFIDIDILVYVSCLMFVLSLVEVIVFYFGARKYVA